jgi:hypothetical protein
VLHLESEVTIKTEDGVVTRIFNFEDDMHRVEQAILKLRVEGKIVRCFIVDPINSYMGGNKKGNMWSGSDARHVLNYLIKFAERMNIAVIGITHLNKSSDTRALYRMLDSIAIVAASRSAWITAKEVDDTGKPTGRVLFAAGRVTNAKPAPTLAYKIERAFVPSEDGGPPIETSRIKWDAVVDISADQALAQSGKGNSEESQQRKAQMFLLQVLADGPVEVNDIKRRAYKQKQAWRTIERAKTELGVISTREGFGKGSKCTWELPPDAPAKADPNAATVPADYAEDAADPDHDLLYSSL